MILTCFRLLSALSGNFFRNARNVNTPREMGLYTVRLAVKLATTLTLTSLLVSCANPGGFGSSSSSSEATMDLDSAMSDSDSGRHIPLDTILAQNKNLDLRQSPEIALQALSAAAREKRWEVAKDLLAFINPGKYQNAQLAEYTLAASQYWLHGQQNITAIRWLDGSQLQNALPLMTSRQQILISIARADVLYALGNYHASAQERIFIESLLNNESNRRANASAIWNTLLKIPVRELKMQQRRTIDASYKAWLELAIIQHANQLDISEQAAQAQAWRERWPNHSAANNLPESIGALQTISNSRPRAIAALLPLSGPLAQGGKAVQDGLAAAYFTALSQGWELPTLTSYDTHNKSIEQLYNQAINDGADLIIGPLQKEKVGEFLTMPTSVPIITLNYLANGMPPPTNVIQFGLASEDEAVQLAKSARNKNYRNAMIIQSNSDWSRRASEAFTQQWLELEGTILANTTLSQADNYSNEIESSLLLPESNARHKRVQNIIGKILEFTPRRRHDVDVIIVFANSKQTKSIKPLLSYHYAGKIPVYSSSHVNDGDKKNKNRDLNGIVFNEIPWVLESNAIKRKAAKRYSENKNLGRLFAMGVDAFYLHPRIEQLQRAPDTLLNGMTGNLSVRDNRVVRELELVKFVGGKAKKLNLSK